jgi:predicted unusual protein kinase regulating ubiquinone biosynthesis (AarF/ABC1/UbiB family)
MDTIAYHLRSLSGRVDVPRSLPGLVSRRVLVMQFMEGIPLLELRGRFANMSERRRRQVRRAGARGGRARLGETGPAPAAELGSRRV